ncbi:MAG: phosphoribosylaminoimidazolesuccinocarboxamide synthase [Candidatus Omnitrophica bacterium]|nr:phosphoribosylaminoimidazolesuccinocarboxamide synthase [Candidatus Omnitrophota bacterium]
MKNKLPLALLYSGKVRDLYRLSEKEILMVASDRISAFDYILPTPVPDKGKILTQLSVFWFRKLEKIVPNHLLVSDFASFPASLQPFGEYLAGRSLIVKEVKKIKIEAVVRGYLAGSGWEEYRVKGTVGGIPLPAGLQMASRLPEPLFTPATKEEVGNHDRNITFAECAQIAGPETAGHLRDKSIALYRAAAEYALQKGIIIADTKFEFGFDDQGGIILIDEMFTPDSSRFWEKEKYQPGQEPASLDKQYVRNYLLGLKWDKNPPVPELPAEVVANTRGKYQQIYEILTG